MTEGSDSRREEIEEQRPVRVLVQRIEGGIVAVENLIHMPQVTEIVAKTEADEKHEADGGRRANDEAEFDPPTGHDSVVSHP